MGLKLNSSKIKGVEYAKIKPISNPKGDIYHALKRSDKSFRDFGEAYFTSIKKLEVKGWKKTKAPSDTMVHTHRSIENALKMPAFTLNVRNQISNRLLLAVIGIQLLTNILLILMVWMKIG